MNTLSVIILTAAGSAGENRREVEAERCSWREGPGRKSGKPVIDQLRGAVGRHLADQLMLPMALAGSGRFRTLPLSRHSATNLEVIGHFLKLETRIEKTDHNAIEVELSCER